MITSAYFFVGRMKSSKAGLTNFENCGKKRFVSQKQQKRVDNR
jgi:hypothetical protein